MSGPEVCRILREERAGLPIIMLEELVPSEEALDRTVDGRLSSTRRNSWCVTRRGRPVALTAAEFRILELLVRFPGRVFARGGSIAVSPGDAVTVIRPGVQLVIRIAPMQVGDELVYLLRFVLWTKEDGTGIAGGNLGGNACIETGEGWAVVVLSNYDPPSAEVLVRGAMGIIRGRLAEEDGP